MAPTIATDRQTSEPRIRARYETYPGFHVVASGLRGCPTKSRLRSYTRDVVLDGGKQRKRVHLNRSCYGLLVCPMIGRELDNFSFGSVCMVLASSHYDESNYYRDYGAFVAARD